MSHPENLTAVQSFSFASQQDAIRKPARRNRQKSRLSVRLDEAERKHLERLAGSQPLSAYVRDRLLGDAVISKKIRPKKKARTPKADQAVAAQLLASLGQSRLSTNLNQIAKLAHQGALPVTSELQAELHDACLEIAWMRRTLVKSLGIKDQ